MTMALALKTTVDPLHLSLKSPTCLSPLGLTRCNTIQYDRPYDAPKSRVVAGYQIFEDMCIRFDRQNTRT